MANHKKEWSKDDTTLNKLKFPQLPPDQLYQVPTHGELALSKYAGFRPTPTYRYKYRCVDCGIYYDYESNHNC